MPGIRTICVLYVELIRGVPLVSVLFMASVMFPLFVPAGMTIDKCWCARIGFTLFSAAYVAEVVRGGLQAMPAGRYEAAAALGLSLLADDARIVLPQALRIVVPALMNTFIGALQGHVAGDDRGLFDLTGALQLALGDARWRKFALEGLPVRRGGLLRVLLRDVALQPVVELDVGTRRQ